MKTLSNTHKTLLKHIEDIPSKLPFVTISPAVDIQNVFHLRILAFIPELAEGTSLIVSDPSSHLFRVMTDRGKIYCRKVALEYTPADPVKTYKLVQISIDYQIDDNENFAEGIHVYRKVGDPRTSRGTVTTILHES